MIGMPSLIYFALIMHKKQAKREGRRVGVECCMSIEILMIVTVASEVWMGKYE